MSNNQKTEVVTRNGFSSDIIIGIFFLTAGLIMKHVCSGEDTEICHKIYSDGHILVIVGSIVLAIPFILIIVLGCCLICSKN